MFILQDGKLYIQDGKSVVGVEIYPDKVLKIKGTETKLAEHSTLTGLDVKIRYNIDTEPYIFPREKVKEVVVNEPTVKAKSTDTKSKRK